MLFKRSSETDGSLSAVFNKVDWAILFLRHDFLLTMEYEKMNRFVIYTQLGFVSAKAESSICFSNNISDDCIFECIEKVTEFIKSKGLEKYSPSILSYVCTKGDCKPKSGYVIETDKGLVGLVNHKIIYVQTLDNAYLFEDENTARLISVRVRGLHASAEQCRFYYIEQK